MGLNTQVGLEIEPDQIIFHVKTIYDAVSTENITIKQIIIKLDG